jgi:hydroxymethylpyrimidine/phosphomethylpyrimidine kinase
MNIALTIAGSDSSGGAGVQADLKTFHQFGVYGTTVIIALTAQNTRGVHSVHTVPETMVEDQLAALAGDLPPAALKTGMLAAAPLVRVVARAIRGYGWSEFVCDPVMVATSGDRLLDPEAEAVLRDLLLPLATVVTPNLDEAAILTGLEVRDQVQMELAGRRLLELGAGAALVKSGHLPGDLMTDVLVTGAGVRRFTHARINTSSTHGTGCTLSAAITAGLALGRSLEESVVDGLDYLQRAIAAAPGLGAGHGPVNHMVAVRRPGPG